jgi:AhpD family alkylhydroperoxidase
MARVAYAEETDSPEIARLAHEIRAERGGRMLNLYRMLMNSPPLAAGWLKLFTAIRQQTTLPGDCRELAILRVALVNGARYEYDVHVPFALKEGVTEEKLAALEQWQDADVYSARERALLAYVDAMTRDIHVPPAVFDPLRAHFDQRQLVELTATVAGYNLVSRFLEALEVDPETAPRRPGASAAR